MDRDFFMARSNLWAFIWEELMAFVEDLVGANFNKYSNIGGHKSIFCRREHDHPLTLNQRLTYFDSFKLSDKFR